jgi:hypothetical protein
MYYATADELKLWLHKETSIALQLLCNDVSKQTTKSRKKCIDIIMQYRFLEPDREIVTGNGLELENRRAIVSRISGRTIRPIERFQPINRQNPNRQNPNRQKTKQPLLRIYYKRNKGESSSFKEKASHNDIICPICIEEKAYIKTNCNHDFCICIVKTLMQYSKTNHNIECPYCRGEIKRLRMIDEEKYKIVEAVSGLWSNIVCK